MVDFACCCGDLGVLVIFSISGDRDYVLKVYFFVLGTTCLRRAEHGVSGTRTSGTYLVKIEDFLNMLLRGFVDLQHFF